MIPIAVIFADASAPPMNSHWLEQLSQISTIVLAAAAIAAIWQIRAAIRQAKCALEQNNIALEQLKVMASQLEVARTDIILRSKREAIAVALEQCKRYADHVVPHFDALTPKMVAKGYQPPQNVHPEFPFIPQEQDPVGAQIWTNEVELRTKIVQTLNELESFAMYFANDLADESIAFTPAGLSFCQICEYYRLFIGVHRQPDKIKLYQNVVKLYGMWRPRLERTVLEEQGKALEAKKQKLPADKKGTPLGTGL